MFGVLGPKRPSVPTGLNQVTSLQSEKFESIRGNRFHAALRVVSSTSKRLLVKRFHCGSRCEGTLPKLVQRRCNKSSRMCIKEAFQLQHQNHCRTEKICLNNIVSTQYVSGS